ncbi:MAG: cation:proton antiporter [Anaerolineales bacterium]
METTFLQLAFLLVVILVSAKMAGYLSIRLNQPAVLGEILIGIILGPTVLNILHLPFIDASLKHMIHDLSEMGVLLLMFLAGLELHFRELSHNLRVATLAGTLGVVFPVLGGWGIGRLFGLENQAAIFLGLIPAATSVSISAQTLMELGHLRSRVGLGLLGAAVLDDILAILLLSLFLALIDGSGNWLSLLIIGLRMFAFLALAFGFGLWILPRWTKRIERLPISQGMLAFALSIMLTFSLAADVIGHLSSITGAFLAGLLFARTPQREKIVAGVHALSYGLFVPIFFINIGLSVNARAIKPEMLWLALVMIITAVFSKWLGAGLGGYLGGFSRLESLQLGAGMISRGEVGLIIANVGIPYHLVTDEEFAVVVLMVLVTTLITPVILRALFREPKETVLLAAADPKKENK